MTIEIKKSKDGQYYAVLIADNGQVLMTSEMYTQKHSCKETMEAIDNSFSNDFVGILDKTNDLPKLP
jgi:uncharacterized protein YegP (UPF0339 family)